jgi:hypothetical protein
MSLVQSAKMNGHDPYAYLKGTLQKLPTHPAARINDAAPTSVEYHLEIKFDTKNPGGFATRLPCAR